LAENFCFADHRTVETGGYFKQMRHRCIVVLAVQVRVQVVGRQPARFAEEVTNVCICGMEALGDRVHLDAVTRAQHGNLANVIAHRQTVERFRQRIFRDGNALK